MKKLYKTLVSKAKRNHPGDASTRSEKCPAPRVAEQGLKTIYEGTNPIVDLVAIHGDAGHWQKSWTDQETGVFWLRDMLPNIFSESKILSFGYEGARASTTPVEEIASGLIKELGELRHNTGSESRPIIFLARSFGVILLKGALATSCDSNNKPDGNCIQTATRAILLFGSPENADQGLNSLVTSAMEGQPSITESPQMTAMRRDLKWLQDSNAKYVQIANQFPTRYFMESYREGTPISISTPSEQRSDVIQLSKTHGRMIQFPSAEDEDFLKISEVLQGILRTL